MQSTKVDIGMVIIGCNMMMVMYINAANDSRAKAITNKDPKYTMNGRNQ